MGMREEGSKEEEEQQEEEQATPDHPASSNQSEEEEEEEEEDASCTAPQASRGAPLCAQGCVGVFAWVCGCVFRGGGGRSG